VVVALQQLTSAVYLGAGLVSGAALALAAPRLQRAAVALLAIGVVAQGIGFSVLHSAAPPPPLTDLPTAVSFMAWVGTLVFLLLLLRTRLQGLIVVIGPISFLAVFIAAERGPVAEPTHFAGGGSWPHFHVLLSSAGIALLGLAALAGGLFLAEHRRLKAHRRLPRRLPLPSLEALDRTNAVALAVGFPLLTLGLVTGMIWVHSVRGTYWTATPHQVLSGVAWAVYALLAAARFGSKQGARQAAASAVVGFAFLFTAVIGLGLLR
jgi:ABC-type uncharacterized transport system permease subunit